MKHNRTGRTIADEESRRFKWIAGAAAVRSSHSLPASAQMTYNIASIADFTGPYADIMKDLSAPVAPLSIGGTKKSARNGHQDRDQGL